MKRRIRFHLEARRELLEAGERGEAERPGRGEKLVAAIQKRLALTAAKPGTAARVKGAPAELKAKRVLVSKTRYAIVFLDDGRELLVIAIAHGRRKPLYWLSRARASKRPKAR
jgi:toxin ParE1/3/4